MGKITNEQGFIRGWEMIKSRCKCGSSFIGDVFFQVGPEMMCRACADKADSSLEIVPYYKFNGVSKRVIEVKKLWTLAYGIYKILVCDGYLLNCGMIASESANDIQTAVDDNYIVMEKRREGTMLRFPRSLISSKAKFNFMNDIYKDIFTLSFSFTAARNEFICDGNNVIGVSSILKSSLYKKSFTSYCDDWELLGESAIREQLKNQPVAESVADALKSFSAIDMLNYFEKRLIGQNTEIRKIVLMFYDYLQCVASGKTFKASNWILTAPSGCGKTEVYRILRDFCKDHDISVPVIQVDLSHYTESGYKGKELSEILNAIVNENSSTDGVAVCFLDEADKKFIPSISSAGIDYNAALQANLLTLVEGSIQTVETGSRSSESRTFDTGKTMFVFMGAFQSIRDKKQKKTNKKTSIGFGADMDGESVQPDACDCFYEDISLDDMIEYGMIEELAGRMEQVINLHKISEEDMKRIIKDKVVRLSKEMGVSIELANGAVDDFLRISYTNLGVRKVINTIKSLTYNTLAQAYFCDDFVKSASIVTIYSINDAIIESAEEKAYYEALGF